VSRRRLDAEERAPCGVLGLTEVSTYAGRERAGLVDLGDCLVVRPAPWRLVIWEPLRTKAPSPALAQPFCCYIRTVIFYLRPYVLRPWSKLWRDGQGRLRATEPGAYEQWDRVETRLAYHDVVEFEGELFDVWGGTVKWARNRWWMCRTARRLPDECRFAA
jgi:hypothetical protein